MVKIEVMKPEVIIVTYQILSDSIKPLVERKDDKEQDTFDMSDWWKLCKVTNIHLRVTVSVVLTNSPNSCLPESLFSIFNSIFDADQMSSYTD
jgi:hypothetical protein